MRSTGITADEAIPAFKQASIRRVFPAQYLDRKIEEIEAAARRGDPVARKALKLLFDKRFDK